MAAVDEQGKLAVKEVAGVVSLLSVQDFDGLKLGKKGEWEISLSSSSSSNSFELVPVMKEGQQPLLSFVYEDDDQAREQLATALVRAFYAPKDPFPRYPSKLSSTVASFLADIEEGEQGGEGEQGQEGEGEGGEFCPKRSPSSSFSIGGARSGGGGGGGGGKRGRPPPAVTPRGAGSGRGGRVGGSGLGGKERSARRHLESLCEYLSYGDRRLLFFNCCCYYEPFLMF